MLNCSLRVTEPSISVHRRLLDSVVRTTSRCPISVEANRDVPPPSLAEHRRISVLPQFSTMRFAMAIAPSAMTRITAIGVSHARILVCNAIAPVMNGEDWAEASSGSVSARLTALVPKVFRIQTRCNSFTAVSSGRARDRSVRGTVLTPVVQLFPLGLAWRTETKALDHEGVVVLPLALLIGPVVGTDAGIENQLIALAGVPGDRLAH